MTALRTYEGIYRDGKIELSDVPYGLQEATPVLVTFLESGTVSLRGAAADLCGRLGQSGDGCLR